MSIIERLALGAAAAADADREEYAPAALDLVRSSPLAGWFPVSWQVVDHNLPVRDPALPQMVVVTADEEVAPSTPLRFIVFSSGRGIVQWTVLIAHPQQNGPGWLDDATPVTSAIDVGNWIKAHRP